MTRDELAAYFDIVDEDKRAFALDTIDEYLYFKDQIDRLRKLPLIRVSKKDASRQAATPAAKLIKDYSQVLDAKRGTLLRILYRVENSAADELLSKLRDFE
ncbi:MAG: hypothetical protein IKT98_03775 [Selenomonadaceae bacterium]|nr:hypothetical protein [Selenomonadaceae bacterium]